jgi:hypothetical protein
VRYSAITNGLYRQFHGERGVFSWHARQPIHGQNRHRFGPRSVETFVWQTPTANPKGGPVWSFIQISIASGRSVPPVTP